VTIDTTRTGIADLPRRDFLGLALGAGALIAGDPPPARAAPVNHTLDVVGQFGAVGNGSTDDTNAFKRMNEEARRLQSISPDAQITMVLRSGRNFRYTWNRWTWGVRRLVVTAYGSTVTCTSRSAWDMDKTPLVTARAFFHYFGYYDAAADPTGPQVGKYIKTALRGQNKVTLVNAAEVGSFKPGLRVVVFSYSQQQYGLPPNARHFEFAKVTAVSGGTITLDTTLRYDHHDDYPHPSTYVHCPGKARILLIEKPDMPLVLSQRFEGLKTMPSPYTRAAPGTWDQKVQSWLQVNGCMSTELVDCDLRGVAVGDGASFLARNCFIEYCEPDKFLEVGQFENCRITSLQGCAGMHQAVFKDTTFSNMAWCLAKRSRFERCTFNGANGSEGECGLSLNGQQPIIETKMIDCTFNGRNNRHNYAIADIQPYPRVQIGRDITMTASDVMRIKLDTVYGSPCQKMVDGLRIGSIISVDNNLAAVIRVVDIWGEGGYGYFKVTSTVPLTSGLTLRLRLLETLDVSGARLNGTTRQDIAALRSVWNGTVLRTPPATLATFP
jgi:hypothetical protein